MYAAYEKVFTRCGLTFRSVKAQSGEIGGDTSQEFMAVAAVGEDAFVWCEQCDYAANTEAATKQEVPAKPAPDDAPATEKLHTPDLPGIDEVAKQLKTKPNRLLKSIAFDVDGELGLAVVPGNREVNEFALDQLFPDAEVRIFTDADFAAHPELPKGYIGPDYEGAKHVVADSSVRAPHPWIVGANETDHHRRGAVLGRDFTPTQWAEIAIVEPGDACPKCGAPLRIDRGIEVGHVFQLGTKYTSALGALYTDEEGDQHPMVMGCYGIGVSRIIAAVVEEHHDENGIAWPAALSPFDVHVIAMPGDDSAAEAEKLSDELSAAGLDVLYDDREGRPGVKFADADLIGVPIQVIVGAKGIAKGIVERKVRATGERDEIPRAEAVATIAGPT
jgi:prolyl-tRNA synthetase